MSRRFDALLVPLLLGTSALLGCGALDVTDPTKIEESELENAAGALLLHDNAMGQLANAMSTGVLASGMLSDEFFFVPPSSNSIDGPDDLLDRRESLKYEDRQLDDLNRKFGAWQRVRSQATVAMGKIRQYGPSEAYLGEMYAARGFATVQLAEHFCAGFPLHELKDLVLVYGPPVSSEEAFERARADLDSAVLYAADSARILNFARVAQGRALLGAGRFADAATAVAAVPDDYVYNAEYVNGNLVGQQFTYLGRGVSDGEGGTGMDFVTAGDPRVVTMSLGAASDGQTLYGTAKYPDRAAPIVLASGTEARLIEAEALLRSGGDWRAKLNHLRAESGMALDSLVDPGTEAARVDLLFRERAFWLFLTGHRLGDLRRLIAYYDRDPETVFPTGLYHGGGSYARATSMPFDHNGEHNFNPAVTGCTTR